MELASILMEIEHVVQYIEVDFSNLIHYANSLLRTGSLITRADLTREHWPPSWVCTGTR